MHSGTQRLRSPGFERISSASLKLVIAMSSSKMKMSKAITKRRPRPNIISMLLGSVNKKGAQGSGNSRAHRSRDADSSSQYSRGSRSKESPSRQRSERSHSGERGGSRKSKQLRILASAVELTRRSKTRSNGSRQVQFYKGQKAFYRSSKGINKVTVVGIHHDAKLEPYYTIRLRDGKEKQTDGKHLTPVQEDPPSKESGKTEDIGSSKKSQPGSSNNSGSDVMTDHMSTSSSEMEEQQASQAAPATNDNSYDIVENYTDDEGDAEVVSDEDLFQRGQDAYFRSPDGMVCKVRVLEVYHSSNPAASKGHKYCIGMPDGRRKDVGANRLATLMDLTSNELAMLMKERNDRQGTGGGSVTSRESRASRANQSHQSSRYRRNSHISASSSHAAQSERSKDVLALPSPDDAANEHEDRGGHLAKSILDEMIEEGYEPEEGPASSSSENSSHVGHAETKEQKILALPCAVQMVQAKTEDGGTKMVPLYEADMDVFYKGPNGVVAAHILDVHLDDLLEPYYTVRLEDGREKQTDNAHISLTREVEAKPEAKPSQGGEDKDPDSTERRQIGNVFEDPPETLAGETTKSERALVPVNKEIVHVNRNAIDPAEDTWERESPRDTPVKKQDPSAGAITLAAKFSIGDEVLYNSSQGDHLHATVVRLHRDKKNRPYYVVRLPEGKEKQVYGHRLSPLQTEKPRRTRSRSRTRGRNNSIREQSVESRSRSTTDKQRRSRSKSVNRKEFDSSSHGKSDRRHRERSRSRPPQLTTDDSSLRQRSRPTTPGVSHSSKIYSTGDERPQSSKLGHLRKSLMGRSKQ